MVHTYSYNFRVIKTDIDQFNHVNNVIYLKWIMEASGNHSIALGYDLDRYLKEGAGFVVKQHQINYHQAAYLDDELCMSTWLTKVNALKVERFCELRRLNDNCLMMSSTTCWVYVNLTSGAPTLMSDELLAMLDALVKLRLDKNPA